MPYENNSRTRKECAYCNKVFVNYGYYWQKHLERCKKRKIKFIKNRLEWHYKQKEKYHNLLNKDFHDFVFDILKEMSLFDLLGFHSLSLVYYEHKKDKQEFELEYYYAKNELKNEKYQECINKTNQCSNFELSNCLQCHNYQKRENNGN